MNYLYIALMIVAYIFLGFISFIWNAKRTFLCEFHSDAMKELLFMVIFGPLAFILLICTVICEKFYKFMNKLLKHINK